MSLSSSAALTAYARPIVVGLLILLAGLVPWTLLAALNLRVRPDLPWASLATLVYIAALLAWLNGRGPPRGNSEERRRRLRLWPPTPVRADDAGALTTCALIALVPVVATNDAGLS